MQNDANLIESLIDNNPIFLNDQIKQINSSFPIKWADLNYKYRKNIIISAKNVETNLTNFPLLIDFFDRDLRNLNFLTSKEIIFTDINGKKLPFEIDEFDLMYNSSHSHLIAWVRTNLSSSVDTLISMYYGRLSNSYQVNYDNFWDMDYNLVWHLSEKFGTRHDSTTNNFDGSPQNYDNDEGIVGKIGGADYFDGFNDFINSYIKPSIIGLEGKGPNVISAWVNTENFNRGGIFEFGSLATRSYFCLRAKDFTDQWKVELGGNIIYDFTYPSKNSWVYFTALYDKDFLKIFANGEIVLNKSIKLNIGDKINFNIGKAINYPYNGIFYDYFNGIIDEVRVSTVIRSDAWIRTEFKNQLDPRNFISISKQETDETPPVVLDFGAKDDGNGTVTFYAIVKDDFTNAKSVSLLVNHSEYQMIPSNNEMWIFRYTVSNFGETLIYTINNASDGFDNFLKDYLSEKIVIINKDTVAPKVIKAYFVQNDIQTPTEITFFAEIFEYGPGIKNVYLLYYFEEVNISESTGGLGASSLQESDVKWQQIKMTFYEQENNTSIFSASVSIPQKGTNLKILYNIVTEDNNGNIDENAFNNEQSEASTGPDIIIVLSYEPSIDPIILLFLTIIVISTSVVLTLIYSKRKMAYISNWNNKTLILNSIDKIDPSKVQKSLLYHTQGIIISRFDEEKGPIPFFVLPETLKNDPNTLYNLCFRAFSNCEFAISLETVNQAHFNYTLNQKSTIKVISYSFALNRPEARNEAENISLLILLYPDIYPIIRMFDDTILTYIKQIQRILDKEPNKKRKIFFKLIELREFISKIIISYQGKHRN